MANPIVAIPIPSASSEGPSTNNVEPNSNGASAGPPAGPLKWPTIDDVREDWAWAHQVEESGGFGEYVHKHVAIFNKKVVGAGKDYTQLRREMAAKFGVHPQRIIITYIDSDFVDVGGDA